MRICGAKPLPRLRPFGGDLAAPNDLARFHFEDIGKVAGKCQGEREIDRLRTVVGERDPFTQRPVAQIDRAPDVDGVLEEDDPVILVEIRVREIDMEAEVVVPDR